MINFLMLDDSKIRIHYGSNDYSSQDFRAYVFPKVKAKILRPKEAKLRKSKFWLVFNIVLLLLGIMGCFFSFGGSNSLFLTSVVFSCLCFMAIFLYSIREYFHSQISQASYVYFYCNTDKGNLIFSPEYLQGVPMIGLPYFKLRIDRATRENSDFFFSWGDKKNSVEWDQMLNWFTIYFDDQKVMVLWNFSDVVKFLTAVERFGKVVRSNLDINYLFRELMMRLPNYLDLEENKAGIEKLVEEEKRSSYRESLQKQIEIYQEFVATLKDKSRLGRSKDAEAMRKDYESKIEYCQSRLEDLTDKIADPFPESEQTIIAPVPQL